MNRMLDHDFSRAIRGNDCDEGKYRLGMLVRYKHPIGEGTGRITSKNLVEEGTVEYAVEGFPYLLWEDEIVGIIKER